MLALRFIRKQWMGCKVWRSACLVNGKAVGVQLCLKSLKIRFFLVSGNYYIPYRATHYYKKCVCGPRVKNSPWPTLHWLASGTPGTRGPWKAWLRSTQRSARRKRRGWRAGGGEVWGVAPGPWSGPTSQRVAHSSCLRLPQPRPLEQDRIHWRSVKSIQRQKTRR
jgi:hypothetical protein